MPWIYWGLLTRESNSDIRSRVPSIVLSIPGVTVQSPLKFVVGAYLLNGTFLGYKMLDTELQMCTTIPSISWTRPGQSIETACKINIDGLVKANEYTIFYDLCTLI